MSVVCVSEIMSFGSINSFTKTTNNLRRLFMGEKEELGRSKWCSLAFDKLDVTRWFVMVVMDFQYIAA